MYFNIFQRFVALDLDSLQHEIPVLICLFCRCRTYVIVMVYGGFMVCDSACLVKRGATPLDIWSERLSP